MNKWEIRGLIGTACVLAIFIAGTMAAQAITPQEIIAVHQNVATSTAIDELKGKTIAQMQDYVLHELSAGCETKGATEPTAVIVLDTNNQMSIGEYQFQIKTVQQYYKKLYGKDISRTEAIELAINHEKATDLARDIIFKLNALEGNWVNCNKSQQLRVQVNLIRSQM